MKTAVIQLNASDDKVSNIKKACSFVKEAAKAKAEFILLPEVFTYRGRLNDIEVRKRVVETVPGDTSTIFRRLAKQYAVNILMGSIYEKSNGGRKVYNTSILINKKGKIVAKYRKMNLFEAIIDNKKIEESEHFLKGKKPAVAAVGEFKIGLSICFDLRFAALYKKYYNLGATVLCVPSAFTKVTGKAHWATLLRARAIENLSYVLAPNQIGRDGRGIEYYGHSMIIDPWGQVLSEASANKEEIIYATLDMEMIKNKRKILSIR